MGHSHQREITRKRHHHDHTGCHGEPVRRLRGRPRLGAAVYAPADCYAPRRPAPKAPPVLIMLGFDQRQFDRYKIARFRLELVAQSRSRRIPDATGDLRFAIHQAMQV